MLQAFKIHIETKFPELLKTRFLLACSGGIDSMVLTDLCAKCGMDFALVHCNFQLRGADSDADEKFVGDAANTLNLKYYVTHFDTINYTKKHKVSMQMAARELRYAWFAEIMRQSGIKLLVTAHHADDNLETFLINLSRGTGIKGLTGIPEKTDSIARPLLPFSREQIAEYAHDEKIEWREDSSNLDIKYLRNNIRHRILPLLKALNPKFSANFRDSQNYLSQTATIADNHIGRVRAAIFEKKGKVIKIPIAELTGLGPLQGYLYGLFNSYGFTEWDDVENLLTAMTGKELRSKTHRLVKNRNFLLLTKIKSRDSRTYQIQEGQTEIEKPVKISITEVAGIEETGPHILYVAKNALKYPLTLRKREKGDYFCPFGMEGTKKLSKFFKDEKIDLIAKENQWLLCSEKAIVWVVGKRADERFKVLENTEEIVRFKLKL
ncbi:tRNA(Ile)-lysidine synthase [Pricia antarctica]|uniref:tRNA(Ile)-lysidine synthase n=1 Tax=Pricia antarctica TaxID=641691 RepID=A0A1G7EIX6_9FLAO|nr:tRNA lysidine(34) synthetase TilS [Pricia antarctica]SDE63395.1 tRNA(Ile)-lysidine synthase [Pricia antarctica]